jgi:hypothetical protein
VFNLSYAGRTCKDEERSRVTETSENAMATSRQA